MKHNHIFTVIVLISVLLVSCEEIAMHPEPGEDNLSIFEEYVHLVNTKFALSEVKGVNLDALADSIRPFISLELSEQDLFEYLFIIAMRMQEGHTTLEGEGIEGLPVVGGYPWYEGYPLTFSGLLTDKYYYGSEANPDVQVITPEDSFFEIKYGFLPQDPEIGYIYIPSFNMNVSNREIEEMMEYLKDTRGMIIEVRSNLGGYIEFGARLTSFFTENEYVFGLNYIKNGPGPDDFVPSEMKITPSGSPFTYTKPVMLLHNRISFSTGSIFPVMMSPLEHVTTLGQITGGGTGEIIDGYLSNGWIYHLSTSNLVDHLGRPTDNGIEPDIPVAYNEEDSISDAFIDRAILEIQMLYQ